MRISDYIVSEIGYQTYQINERGICSFYMAVGEERGVLIDCGAGSIDAKAIADHLCPNPYDVLIGHAHGDHCGAINQWSQIYMHPGDLPVLHNNYRVNEQLWENPNIWRTGANHKVRWPDGSLYEWPTMESGARDLFDFGNFRFMGVNPDKLPEILPLQDGQVFDLGGRTVTVVHLPGHSPGSCCFIDSGTQIAFTSDSFYMLCYSQNCSVEQTLERLEHFNAYRSQFRRIYYGHTSCATCLSNFSLPASAVDDAIDICRELLAGSRSYETVERRGRMLGMTSKGHISEFLFDPDWLTESKP